MASYFKIEYDKLPEQALGWFDRLPNHTKVSIYLILGAILACLILYAVFIYADNQLEKGKKKRFIKITFDQFQNFDLVTYSNKIRAFLSETHDILGTEVISYEIYSKAQKHELYIGCNDEDILNAITNYLSKLNGYLISDIIKDRDPLDSYFNGNQKTAGKRLYLRKNFYPIKTEGKNLAEELAEIAEKYDQSTGVMVLLRSVDKIHAIESQISKINGKMNPSKSGNYSKQKQIELFEEKSQTPIFLTEIYVFSGNSLVSKSLASIIKGMPGKNRFGSRNFGAGKTLLNKIKTRHVTKENLFTPVLRIFFGSYLNASELTALFLPIKVSLNNSENSDFIVRVSK